VEAVSTEGTVTTDSSVTTETRAPAPAAETASSTPPVAIDLTPKAVEMAKKAIDRRGTPTAALRLGVRGGGCSGASYVIEFADKIRERDHVFDFTTAAGEPVKVVVDPKSLVYLRGSVLDYEVKLMSHGFKFQNPNEKKGCGCGESFAI
jgi:iron-sulfur cluster assembly protein